MEIDSNYLHYITFLNTPHLPGRHPPGEIPPPGRHTPLGRHPPADTPWADTPKADTHPIRHPPGRHIPLARHPPGRHPHCLGRHPNPLGRQPPLPDGQCTARYASYWNAFLFIIQTNKSYEFCLSSPTGKGSPPQDLPDQPSL